MTSTVQYHSLGKINSTERVNATENCSKKMFGGIQIMIVIRCLSAKLKTKRNPQ